MQRSTGRPVATKYKPGMKFPCLLNPPPLIGSELPPSPMPPCPLCPETSFRFHPENFRGCESTFPLPHTQVRNMTILKNKGGGKKGKLEQISSLGKSLKNRIRQQASQLKH